MIIKYQYIIALVLIFIIHILIRKVSNLLLRQLGEPYMYKYIKKILPIRR